MTIKPSQDGAPTGTTLPHNRPGASASYAETLNKLARSQQPQASILGALVVEFTEAELEVLDRYCEENQTSRDALVRKLIHERVPEISEFEPPQTKA